jgi:hypothetical protein
MAAGLGIGLFELTVPPIGGPVVRRCANWRRTRGGSDRRGEAGPVVSTPRSSPVTPGLARLRPDLLSPSVGAQPHGPKAADHPVLERKRSHPDTARYPHVSSGPLGRVTCCVTAGESVLTYCRCDAECPCERTQ